MKRDGKDAGDSRRRISELEVEIDMMRMLLREKEFQLRRMRINATPAGLRRSRGTQSGNDALVVAATTAGYTVRSLAEKIGVNHSTLSLARNGHRRIRREVADQVEALIGFEASAKNWPGGIAG